MVKSKDLREVAISHFKNGKKAPEIAKLLADKLHRTTVHRWLDRFESSGSVGVKKKSGRPKTDRTKRLINLVRKRLESSIDRKSLRTMEKDFNSTRDTIRRVLTKNLGKKCYLKINVQKLKEDQQQIRKTCCTWIRNNINNEKLRRIMFSDQKIFTRNGYFNPKNDVIWADSRYDANEAGGYHETEEFPVSVMVALGATWNGLTEAYFFWTNARLNGKTYHETLLSFYKEEGDRLYGHKNWDFQQDGASCHTDSRAQSWCRKHFDFFIPKERWPPNSPELIPLDYSIWNQISRHVDYKKVKNVNDIRRKVKKAMMKIDLNCVREVIGVFLRRVYSVEKNEGELIIDEYN